VINIFIKRHLTVANMNIHGLLKVATIFFLSGNVSGKQFIFIQVYFTQSIFKKSLNFECTVDSKFIHSQFNLMFNIIPY